MKFSLTDEQKMIRDMARDFAERAIKPIAAQLDEEARFPSELVSQMAALGLMGVAVPEEWGGSGMDNMCYAIAMEEIAVACASTAVTMSVNNSLVCDPILSWGTDAQREKYLRPLAQGKLLGCYALSEPGTGSDAAAQKTIAVRDGDDYVITGTKNFITNGPHADICILYAMTDAAKGHKGISGFIVEMGSPGCSVGKVEKKLGIRASSTSSLIFEECRVPVTNRLGAEGEGFKVAMSTLDGGRIGIAAQALGIARAAFEEAVRYSTEREAFGAPIADLQAIQMMIADMATEIDAARLLIWRAASLKDAQKKGAKIRYTKEAAMAKLFASEMSHRVCTKALQIHGGYGYLKDFPLERYYRDQRITEIYEGTSEIQRVVIARATLSELMGS